MLTVSSFNKLSFKPCLFLANILYFGCRSSSKDQHYGSEWQKYALQQKLQYKVAFSRDGEEKVYVQDLIREDAEQIWRIVGEHKGCVFISGLYAPMLCNLNTLEISYDACWHHLSSTV